jgi:hypothetical protein
MLPGVMVGLIFCGLLAAFGLYRLYQYYNFYRHTYARGAWPETAGTVVGGFTGYTPGMRNGKVYYAVIQYHYLVQGSKYMGEIKKHTLGGKRAAQRLVENHPPGSTIPIHYNPAQPKEHGSVLDKSRGYLVVSVILLIFGFLGIITAFTTW